MVISSSAALMPQERMCVLKTNYRDHDDTLKYYENDRLNADREQVIWSVQSAEKRKKITLRIINSLYSAP